jgi:ABC-type Fe3+ transport system substrate-binding protein
MSDVLVYAVGSRAQTARALLASACQATGLSASLELYSTGSLYQRLGPRHAPPLPDVVLWFGPFAADAAMRDGLVQAHQPPRLADGTPHSAEWGWIALDYLPLGVTSSPGSAPLGSFADTAGVPRLALADPERSEVGLSVLLASLDRSRQVDGDAESAWAWWQSRARVGLVLSPDEQAATARVRDNGASHALTLLDPTSTPLAGLAPIPNAISLAASARNVEGGRRLIDWLVDRPAAAALPWSPWQAASGPLGGLLANTPALDVTWARQQYTAARQRWAASGFGPQLNA